MARISTPGSSAGSVTRDLSPHELDTQEDAWLYVAIVDVLLGAENLLLTHVRFEEYLARTAAQPAR